jgi:hypothetical protein
VDNFNPVTTGSLKMHVVAELGGKNKPKLVKALTRTWFDLGQASNPEQVTEIVRQILRMEPPPLYLKMVTRGAGSVISGLSPFWNKRKPESFVERICEVDGDANDEVDEDAAHCHQDLILTELRKGWRHPWRRQSWEIDKERMSVAGRPRLSDEELEARTKEAVIEVKRKNWIVAARIATNLGQSLRGRAKIQTP